jgi:hypothetical protein
MKPNPYSLLVVMLITTFSVYSQTSIPTIKATSNKVSVRLDKQYYPNAWEITPRPENDPDITGTEVAKEGSFFSFITDIDSIGFFLKQGESKVFRIVLNGKDTTWSIALGRYPKAVFNETYQKANNGKTPIEIPPAYELGFGLAALRGFCPQRRFGSLVTIP